MEIYMAYFSPTELLDILNSFSFVFALQMLAGNRSRSGLPLQMQPIPSAANLLLLLARASSSRKKVFVFLKLKKKNFYQSDQSRGTEEINGPPCLLSSSPLPDVFLRSSRALGPVPALVPAHRLVPL